MTKSILRVIGFAAVAAALVCTGCYQDTGETEADVDAFLELFHGKGDTKVTFDPVGGKVNPSHAKVKAGETLAALPTPAKDGHTFNGWYSAETDGEPVTTNTVFTTDTVVYAKWQAGYVNTYLVRFNPNGGEVVPLSGVTTASGTLVFLPTPTRTNHRFDGWYTAEKGGLRVDDNRVYTANTTIHARWTPIVCVAKFLSHSDVVVYSLEIQRGSKIIKPANPERAGYNFGGWYRQDTCSADWNPEVKITCIYKWDFDKDSVISDTTLYAHWMTNKVTFDTRGGTFVNPQDVLSGSSARKPDNPERDGYIFGGWCKDTECKNLWNFDEDAVTKDDTLFAKWAPICVITFDAAGGTVSPASDSTGADGTLASLPTPAKSGSTFNGWYTAQSGGANVTTNTVFQESATIYARWVTGSMTTYTVTFNATGGTVYPASGNTTANGTLPSLPTPARTDFAFDGWFTAASGGSRVTTSTVFGANTTIYAQWVRGTYTITFNATGGTVSPASGSTNASGRLASLPTPDREGFTFNGWYTTELGGAAVTTSTVFTSNNIIYARWVDRPVPVYTITFNANGGTVDPTSGTTNADGTLSSLPTPDRTGYEFNGWFKTTSGSEQVTTSTVFTANAEIFAHWNVRMYNVLFDTQGGGNVPSQSVAHGGNATEPAVRMKAGHTFGGWYTEAACTNPWKFSADAVTSDITLYAMWTPHTYDVLFDSNTGDGAPPKTVRGVTYGSKIPTGVPIPLPTRTGYTFEGWYRYQNGSGEWDFDVDVVMGTTTLYAKWKAIEYWVEFLPRNGGPGVAFYEPYGAKLTKPGDPANTGFTFGGWYKDEACTDPWDFSTDVVTSDVTLYAKWEPDGCSIDGYKTVTIGSQTWMAENLNCDVKGWPNSMCLGDDPANCAIYGRLYDNVTAKRACPVGWHLPSKEEWQLLVDFVGGLSAAGEKLKSTSGWSKNGNGTDDYGFSALPGSFKGYTLNGEVGYWWTSTQSANDYYYRWQIHYSMDDVSVGTSYERNNYFSVRCVEN